jgi:hypothetical protein
MFVTGPTSVGGAAGIDEQASNPRTTKLVMSRRDAGLA